MRLRFAIASLLHLLLLVLKHTGGTLPDNGDPQSDDFWIENPTKPVNYTCKDNEILTVDRKLPRYPMVTMTCRSIVACNENLPCKQMEAKSPTGGQCPRGQYLTMVQDTSVGLKAGCCKLGPNPVIQDSCYKYKLRQNTQGEQRPSSTDTGGSQGPIVTVDATGNASAQSELKPKTLQSAASSDNDNSKPDIDLYTAEFPFKHKRNPEVVRSIVRNQDGWEIIICELLCNSNQVSSIANVPPETTIPITTSTIAAKTLPIQGAEPDHPNIGNPTGQRVEGVQPVPLSPDMKCFSGADTVTTKRGRQRMDEMTENDEVLTAVDDGTGAFVAIYEPVKWFIHRDPNRMAEFWEIQSTSGSNLTLTRDHLIHVVPCGTLHATPDLVAAHTLRIGMCILRLDANSCLRSDRIIAIGRRLRQGLFSPVTHSGNLLVNDVLTSCYSSSVHVPLGFQRGVFSFLLKIRETYARLLSARWDPDANDRYLDVHPMLKFLLYISDNFFTTS